MIELKNLTGGYGNFETVRDVSLVFPNGQITAIIGHNGCGKSTLLNLCNGILHIKQGEVWIDGQSISVLSRADMARKMALLSQSRIVPDMTVDALVLHGRFPWLKYPRIYTLEDKEIANNAMIRTGILKKRFAFMSKLSGGERQKAYLAMLLAQNTDHILLDEPTTWLDIAHQLELLTMMTELRQENKCVVTVLHDLGMALEIADKVAVMKNGKLLMTGTPKEVVQSGAIEESFGVKILRKEQIGFQLG